MDSLGPSDRPPPSRGQTAWESGLAVYSREADRLGSFPIMRDPFWAIAYLASCRTNEIGAGTNAETPGWSRLCGVTRR